MSFLPKQVALAIILVFIIHQSKAQTFTEASQAVGIDHLAEVSFLFGGGVSIFDADNDGDEDVYITGCNARDHLYINDGNGFFQEMGIAAGLGITGDYNTFGVTTGDIDNDGDRDIFLTSDLWEDTLSGLRLLTHNRLFRNNGDLTFTDISISAGIIDTSSSTAATMGDYNLDGYLDIYVANYVEEENPLLDSNGVVIGYTSTCFPNYYYQNNGDNTFTEMAQSLAIDNNGCGLAIGTTDYNSDSYPDVYVANDFGRWIGGNALFENDHTGGFTDVSVASGANIGLFAMGVAAGDYDEDQDFDYYITNIGPNALLNNDNGTFTDVALAAGVEHGYSADTLLTTGWGTGFLDYDHDTYLDLFAAYGHIDMPEDLGVTTYEDPNKLFKNNGDGTFSDVSALEQIDDVNVSHGFAYGDLDKDGDLDMVVSTVNEPTSPNPRSLYYRNDLSNGNAWLKVSLEGVQSNRDGFGSRVIVKVAGRTFIREIDGGSSHASQHSSIAHFGLGSYTMVDSVLIVWPGGGMQLVENIAVNQQIHLVEDYNTSVHATSLEQLVSLQPNPVRNELHLAFSKEFKFDNLKIFNVLGQEQYLPNYLNSGDRAKLSTEHLQRGYYFIQFFDDEAFLGSVRFLKF